MIYGGVSRERISCNESSLTNGNEDSMGSYQPFGELQFIQSNVVDSSCYVRRLDIANAVSEVCFGQEGNRQKRSIFVSYPDQVMVFRVESEKGIDARIALVPSFSEQVSGDAGCLHYSGEFPTGLKYHMGIRVLPDKKAALEYDDGAISIHDCRDVLIILSAATSYVLDYSRGFLGGNPDSLVNARLDNAVSKGYSRLRSAHCSDFRSLYDTFSIDLGKEPLGSDTYDRLSAYRSGDRDPSLEALLCQYGRYLLISSSRPGGLPANLQGIWNESKQPPWMSQYTTDINIQMNYWPSELTGLEECHLPLFDYIKNISMVQKLSDDSALKTPYGWKAYFTMNTMGGSTRWKINDAGPAWLVRHYWDHYAYSGDRDFLSGQAYDMLKDQARYWQHRLVKNPDGFFLDPGAYSPEHLPAWENDDSALYPGVSYVQQIVYDLFTNYMSAADVLGVDRDYRDTIADIRARMLPPRIGSWGQLQEWMEDWDSPEDKHRHLSHLFAVYPGNQITLRTTPDLAEAALVSLKARGLESTGWSMAWKINLYARLQQAGKVDSLINTLFCNNLQDNLFDTHPPFQIDGNFGYVSGVVECLLQCQDDTISLLPALCDRWRTGSVSGIHTKGGFIIDMQWQDGRVTTLRVKSQLGGNCRILTNGEHLAPDNRHSDVSVVQSWSPNPNPFFRVDVSDLPDPSGYCFEFQTKAGQTYSFHCNGN